MANEYYEVNVGIMAGGQFADLVFHYRIANPSNADEFIVASELVEQLLDTGAPGNWIFKLLALISEDAFISSVRARRVAPSGGNTSVQSLEPTDLPGAVASGIKAQQIAACIIWIPTVSPSKTGRNFVPGIPDSALAASRWDTSYISDVDDFIATHVVGFSSAAGVWLPVVYDRNTDTGDVVMNGYLSPKVGTQRRREIPI